MKLYDRKCLSVVLQIKSNICMNTYFCFKVTLIVKFRINYKFLESICPMFLKSNVQYYQRAQNVSRCRLNRIEFMAFLYVQLITTQFSANVLNFALFCQSNYIVNNADYVFIQVV